MNNQDESRRLITAALFDAHRHPPAAGPDKRWREGVMAEIRAFQKKPARPAGPVLMPNSFFRLAPLLAAASAAVCAVAWTEMGGLYGELSALVLTNLPRAVELYLFGL